MRIIALDPSLTGTGVIHTTGSASTITTKLKDEPRLIYLVDTILDIITSEMAEAVILEGLAYGSKFGKVAERDALHFMIRTNLYRMKVPYSICPPTCLKRWITGSGAASKDEVLLAAARLLPIEFKNNNEADAGVLWSIAKDHYGEPIVQVPAANRSMLGKVEWEING